MCVLPTLPSRHGGNATSECTELPHLALQTVVCRSCRRYVQRWGGAQTWLGRGSPWRAPCLARAAAWAAARQLAGPVPPPRLRLRHGECPTPAAPLLSIRSKDGRGKVSRVRAHVQLCRTHVSSYWESRRRGLRAPWHGSRIGGCRCMCRRWELRRPSRRCRQSQRRPQQLQTCRSDRRPRSGMQSSAQGPACLQQRVPACIHERNQFRVSTVQ